jgi:SOS-response transcriptional repressor LexA
VERKRAVAGKAMLKQGERRRKAIVRFIGKYQKKYGCSPTIAEIAEAVGLSSPNATRNHLFRLRDEGKIVMRPGVARAISLVPEAKGLDKAS